MAALLPFVSEWRLSLNPEDLDEMAYAVLRHARSGASFEEIDADVRGQLSEYRFKQERFQRQAYGGMGPAEAAIRGVVDLLARAEFDTIERMAPGSRLRAAHLAHAVGEYGRTLVPPGDGWWSTVTMTQISGSSPTAMHVAAPLWTAEEGRSDLTLEVRLSEVAAQAYEISIEDLHVL